MRDLLLQCSGVVAIAVALIHGVLGETKVFARARIEPERLRTLIRLVWQASTVAWIGGGVLLIAAPWMDSELARRWIVVTMICCSVSRLSPTRGPRAAAISAGWRSVPSLRWRLPAIEVPRTECRPSNREA